MRCTPDRRQVDLSMPATVADFGFDLHNHRHLTAQEAGISTADFRQMDLAWPWPFRAPRPCARRQRVGSTLFLPVADASQLYAIDIAAQPCLKWIYKSEVPLRTGIGYGALRLGTQGAGVCGCGHPHPYGGRGNRCPIGSTRCI